VLLARDLSRPATTDYIQLVFDEFIELHGDKAYKDDKAIICGFSRIAGRKFMLVGHRKGKNTQERLVCNFGSAHPEGYRKAMEKMKLAEKFHLPIVTFINTPGAYPGIGAEERGQAYAIANNIYDMSVLKTPIICIVIGEGGSGGALGIGIGDILAMLENAYFSVISPEGCAAILWRDGAKAPEAAGSLKLSPQFLVQNGIMDDIIPEPLGGAHRNHKEMAEILKKYIIDSLDKLKTVPMDELLEKRYQKYRRIGRFLDEEGKMKNGE
jgi:acetyl-CoA carboxylase carboxyl transferase subunit alpha